MRQGMTSHVSACGHAPHVGALTPSRTWLRVVSENSFLYHTWLRVVSENSFLYHTWLRVVSENSFLYHTWLRVVSENSFLVSSSCQSTSSASSASADHR